MDKSISKELFFLRNYLQSNIDVWVNTTRLGVVLPSHLYAEKNTKLVLGLYGMAIPIPIEVNWEGIRCTLSFNRQPFACQIPWSAVFCIKVLTGLPEGKDYILFPEDANVEEVKPELAPTGTDSAGGGVATPFGTLVTKPSAPQRAKRPLPPGWGGLIHGGTGATDNEKEPA